MSREHESGISTACYPAPASVHGSLLSDKERPKLCLWVQTPAPVLGLFHISTEIHNISVSAEKVYNEKSKSFLQVYAKILVRLMRLLPANGVHPNPHTTVCDVGTNSSYMYTNGLGASYMYASDHE